MSQAQPVSSSMWKLHAVGAGVCLLLIGVAYLFGVQPVLKARLDYQAQQEQLAGLRGQASSAVSSLAAMRATLHQTEQSLAQTPLRLESIEQVNQRLARLAELAAANGLSIDQVKPGVAQREGKFAAMPFHVTASGSYPTCVRFMHAVRNDLIDTEVRALHISGQPAQVGQRATFECDLIWYAAPNEAMATVEISNQEQGVPGGTGVTR